MNPENTSPDSATANRMANVFFIITLLTCLAFAAWIVSKVL